MNYIRCMKAAVLPIIMVAIVGCESKQDKSGNAVPAQQNAAAPGTPGQVKGAAPVMSAQDKADARAAAVRVLALMESGDFPAVYKESAPSFKQIGSESQFVGKFQETRKTVGLLKNPQETRLGAIPGNGCVMVYRLENERYKTDFRLSFVRSSSGKMELVGLNQHDELKK